MDHFVAGERETLQGILDEQRSAIAGLLDGLSEEEARRRLVPSLTTPLSLVKHATFVEQVWFHSRVAGRSRAEVGIPETVDESFAVEESDTVESARKAFVGACERSREIAAEHGLDETNPWHAGPVNLRGSSST